MIKRLIPLIMAAFAMIIFQSSCNNSFKGDSFLSDRETILPKPRFDNLFFPVEESKLVSMGNNDLFIVKQVLRQAIDKNQFEFLKNPTVKLLYENFYFQYVPYLNDRSEKCIYINVFCELPEHYKILSNESENGEGLNWKVDFISSNHVDYCTWHGEVNIESESYFNLFTRSNH
ncbi:hypothetical protein AAU57_12800 [Nonlabens sp. YIK11]|uniref:hypothetical protein n=1 Tax=Nonlabens sp. YIK11 TaxID=1453349 RepID=UPI0006DCBC00|nr:hypothetical protein [Nonlabens sp. YIK11]KQC34113.1 hypothetical protein AAU57_12800 [Nonlabens sp. YIK11]